MPLPSEGSVFPPNLARSYLGWIHFANFAQTRLTAPTPQNLGQLKNNYPGRMTPTKRALDEVVRREVALGAKKGRIEADKSPRRQDDRAVLLELQAKMQANGSVKKWGIQSDRGPRVQKIDGRQPVQDHPVSVPAFSNYPQDLRRSSSSSRPALPALHPNKPPAAPSHSAQPTPLPLAPEPRPPNRL